MTHAEYDTGFTFNEYEQEARKTAIYPRQHNLIYPTLGLTGEAGEVAEKVKKLLRDKGGVVTQEVADDLRKEIGDVLWYLAAVCDDLGISLSSAAQENVWKLRDRKERGVIGGNGDNR